ncbi:MAG TPA: hypothetical protein VEQ60_22520 [Longimicrobium sp.]|nr:hypothetical protein [Longimicrobium sp.]
MLPDRFGAFEAIANPSIKLARVAPEEELAMDVFVAEAVLACADDLRQAAASMAAGGGRTVSTAALAGQGMSAHGWHLHR